MSLRLCSRAPWTISSSAAMAAAILASEHMFVQTRYSPVERNVAARGKLETGRRRCGRLTCSRYRVLLTHERDRSRGRRRDGDGPAQDWLAGGAQRRAGCTDGATPFVRVQHARVVSIDARVEPGRRCSVRIVHLRARTATAERPLAGRVTCLAVDGDVAIAGGYIVDATSIASSTSMFFFYMRDRGRCGIGGGRPRQLELRRLHDARAFRPASRAVPVAGRRPFGAGLHADGGDVQITGREVGTAPRRRRRRASTGDLRRPSSCRRRRRRRGVRGARRPLFVLGDERDGSLPFFLAWLAVHVLYGIVIGSFWALADRRHRARRCSSPTSLGNGDETPLWLQAFFVEAFYGVPFAFIGRPRAAASGSSAAAASYRTPARGKSPRNEGDSQARRRRDARRRRHRRARARALGAEARSPRCSSSRFILAAAMRPTVETARQRGVPRGVGIGLHYVVLLGLVAGLLWAVVPRAIDQIDEAIGACRRRGPTSASRRATSTGIRHDILLGLQRRLEDLPSGESLVDPAVDGDADRRSRSRSGSSSCSRARAYWIFERDRAEDLVCSLLPRPQRKKVRDTWDLIDAQARRLRARPGAADRARRRRCSRSRSGRSGCPYWLLSAPSRASSRSCR